MTRGFVFRLLAVLGGLTLGLLFADRGYRALRGSSTESNGDTTQVCEGHYHRPAAWFAEIDGTATILSSTLRPFCRAVEFDVRHNSQGFRGPEYTTLRPPATFRVSVLGDSYTWGQGVDDHQLFTAVAAKHLSRLLSVDRPDSISAVEVLNHGAQGSRFVDHWIRLQAHVEDLDPDLIVIQFTPNDLDWTHLFPFFSQLTRSDIATRPEDRLPLFGRLPAARIGALHLEERLRPYRPESFEWAKFQATVQHLRRFRDRTDRPIVILAFPDVATGPWETGDRQESPFVRRALVYLRQQGFEVIDLESTFDQRAIGLELIVSSNDLHPNPLAHQIAGEALAAYLAPILEQTPASAAAPAWEFESHLRLEAAGRWQALNQDLDSQRDFFARLGSAGVDSRWLVEQRAYLGLLSGDRGHAHELLDRLSAITSELAAPSYLRALLSDSDEAAGHMAAMLEQVPDHAFTLEWILERQQPDDRECSMIERLGRHPLSVAHLQRALEWHREGSCGSPFGPILPTEWQ